MFNVRSVSRQLPPREIALLPPPLPPPIRLELGFGLGLGLLLGLGGNFSRGQLSQNLSGLSYYFKGL